MRYFKYGILAALAALGACNLHDGGHGEASGAHREAARGEHGHTGQDEDDDHERNGAGHGGHGHDESSDLDRPVVALFDDRCEHGIKTHECDECRYEVGVVKAPEALFKDGLLRRVTPEERIVADPLRLTGEVRYDDRRVAHVSTQVDGIIRKVHVTMGDRVKEGQPLIELDSVEIGQTKATYQEALAMEELARRNSERIEALRKEGIASEKEVLGAKQALDAAEIRTGAARGMLKRLGMRGVRKGGGGSTSGRLVLRAPADGTILHMHAVSGEVARANESLLTIGDNLALWVWADLYERDFARVVTEQARGNLKAEVFVKAFPEEPFPGEVDFISPAMSESSRTIKVRVAVPNPEGKLLAGMFADVDLFLAGEEKALSVPVGAVLEDEGRSFVFVRHEGDFYVRREVAPGRAYRGWIAVGEGLTGDEAVVADGAFLLKSDVLRSKMGAGCAD